MVHMGQLFASDALAGRTALVTGASRGIGEAAARALAAAGAGLVLVARDEKRLHAVADEITGHATVVAGDLGAPGAAHAVWERSLAAAGTIDILVNCAGIVAGGGNPRDDSEIDAIFAVNTRAALLLAMDAGDHMSANGGGSIINVSSLAGVSGIAKTHAYSASKGAVDAFTRSMALELGPKAVRVNSIAPGFVDTDFSAGARTVPGLIEAIAEASPLNRIANAEDVADVIVFLASDAARHITGQVLMVDGGYSTTKELVPARLFSRR